MELILSDNETRILRDFLREQLHDLQFESGTNRGQGFSTPSVDPPRTHRALARFARPRIVFQKTIGYLSIHKVATYSPEILRKHTSMPVEVVGQEVRLKPNHIYVLASAQEIELFNGFFCCQHRSKPLAFSNVLAIFLDSLSHSQHRAIAVILSGVDADGAAALKKFRLRGGVISPDHHGDRTVTFTAVIEGDQITFTCTVPVKPEGFRGQKVSLAWEARRILRRHEIPAPSRAKS